MGCGITLTAERRLRAPAPAVRAELVRALKNTKCTIGTETAQTIEARRGNMLTASFGAAKLPLGVTVKLASDEGGCQVAIRIEDRWTSPTGKVWGMNSQFEKAFRDLQTRLDLALSTVDPQAASSFATAEFSTPTANIKVLEKGNAGIVQGAGAVVEVASDKIAGEAPGGPPKAFRGVTALVLDGPGGAVFLPVERAYGLIAAAALVIDAPAGMPEPMVRQIEQLAARIENALSGAEGEVRLPLAAEEQPVVDFLHQQAQMREDLPLRTRMTCTDCKQEKIVNPDYKRLMERNRKIGALMGGVGATIGRGGISPFVLVGQLMRFKGTDPDFVCPRCQGMEAHQGVTTFCPGCGARHDEGPLRSCRCGHDFRRGVTPLFRPAQVALSGGEQALPARPAASIERGPHLAGRSSICIIASARAGVSHRGCGIHDGSKGGKGHEKGFCTGRGRRCARRHGGRHAELDGVRRTPRRSRRRPSTSRSSWRPRRTPTGRRRCRGRRTSRRSTRTSS